MGRRTTASYRLPTMVMQLHLVRVGADDVRLLRLLQLYLHEWSGRLPAKIGPDALYRYDDLAEWRTDTNDVRRAWLFVVDEAPVGFALTWFDGTQTHVEEFFVVVGARHRGVGAAAARALFASA